MNARNSLSVCLKSAAVVSILHGVSACGQPPDTQDNTGAARAPSASQADARTESASPDILLILVDDLNDWVEPLGHDESLTPNISALAARGMTFTNAHTAAPLCNPSRTAFLSGLKPSTTGVYGNPGRNYVEGGAGDWRAMEVFREKPTLPHYLKDSGYLSFGAGKIFHAHTFYPDGYAGLNDPNGWNDFFPAIDRQLPDEIKPADVANLEWNWGALVATDDAMIDGMTTSYVVKRMADTEASPKPRFMAAGIYRPHEPWYLPQEYFARYPLDEVTLPPYKADDLDDIAKPHHGNTRRHSDIVAGGVWKEAVQAYLGSINFADKMVGRVLGQLAQSARADDTIIVLMSDHGFHLGEKNHWRKQTLWERATHIPLIIVAPGVTIPGSRSNVPVSTMDLYPSLAELVGLPIPEHVEGESLVNLLKDPDMAWDRAVVTTNGKGNHSVRDSRYRYTRYADGVEELYDHASDPNEWFNLAEDSATVNIKTRLARWFPTVNAPTVVPPPDSDSD